MRKHSHHIPPDLVWRFANSSSQSYMMFLFFGRPVGFPFLPVGGGVAAIRKATVSLIFLSHLALNQLLKAIVKLLEKMKIL